MSFKNLIFFLVAVSKLSAQSVGGVTSGASSYCDSVNSGFISLTVFTGSVQYWETSTDGSVWTQIVNPTSTQSYNQLKQTTSFRAIVKDGSFPEDTSTISTVTVHVPFINGSITGGGTFCASTGDGTLVLSGFTGTIKLWQYSQNNGVSWTDELVTQPLHVHGDIVQDRIYRAMVQSVPGCKPDSSRTASFTIHKLSEAGIITGSDTLCYGSPGGTLQLSGQTGNITGWYVSEDLGMNWTVLNSTSNFIVYPTVTKTRYYQAAVKNGVCNTDTSTRAIVAVHDAVPANAGPDQTITRFENITMTATGNGDAKWLPGEGLSDSTALKPEASPANTTTYILTVTDFAGCVSSDSMIITVIVPVPTAITPNGDGVNDALIIDKIEDFPRNSLQVFNRWGVIVFEAAPYKNNWMGKSIQGMELPDEMYYMIYDNGTGEKPVAGPLLIKR